MLSTLALCLPLTTAPPPVLAPQDDDLPSAWEQALRGWAEDWYARWKSDPEASFGKSPVAEFWPRFEARAEEGDGQAVLWLLRHLAKADAPDAQRAERARALLARVRAAGSAEWVAEAVPPLVAARADLEPGSLAEVLEALAGARPPTPVSRAALLGLGQLEPDPELSFALSLEAFSDPGEWATLDEIDGELADELAQRVADAVTEGASEYFERWYLDLGDMYLTKPGAPPEAREVYRPLLEGLARRGSVRAALWCLGNVRPSDDAGRQRLAGYLQQATTADLDAQQLRELSWRASSFTYLFGIEEAERAIEALTERAADGATKAQLQYSLAEALCEGGQRERGLERLRKVIETWPEAPVTERAKGKLFRFENLVVGKAVPDFEALDVDGNAFRLSDYEGKVTVLDFWGFW